MWLEGKKRENPQFLGVLRRNSPHQDTRKNKWEISITPVSQIKKLLTGEANTTELVCGKTEFRIRDQNPWSLSLSFTAWHRALCKVWIWLADWTNDYNTRPKAKRMMRMVKTKRPRAMMQFNKGAEVGDIRVFAKWRWWCRQRGWCRLWQRCKLTRLWKDCSSFRTLGSPRTMEQYLIQVNETFPWEITRCFSQALLHKQY